MKILFHCYSLLSPISTRSRSQSWPTRAVWELADAEERTVILRTSKFAYTAQPLQRDIPLQSMTVLELRPPINAELRYPLCWVDGSARESSRLTELTLFPLDTHAVRGTVALGVDRHFPVDVSKPANIPRLVWVE